MEKVTDINLRNAYYELTRLVKNKLEKVKENYDKKILDI